MRLLGVPAAPEVKVLKRQAAHSRPSTVEVKNAWNLAGEHSGNDLDL
jgi:hypothetical protein